MWKRELKKVCKGISILLFVVSLTGCGGEYAGTIEGDAVSGGAVSGSAVSGGSVSGQAVSGQALQEEGTRDFVSVEKKGKYRFCNDSHLYYMEDDWEPIVEYDLSDGSRREIKFGKEQLGENPVKRIVSLCRVDNDWVWYVKEIETDACPFHQRELWRAPIENKKLNVKKEEFVFSDPLVMSEVQIYCDGRYLLYTTDTDLSSYYRKYDLKEKKYVYNAEPNEDEDEVDMLVAVAGGAAFVEGYDGLFRQNIDSTETVTVTKEIIDQKMAATEEDLFYLQEAEEEEEDDYVFNIWQYHVPDGSKKEIITDEQLQKALKAQGLLNSAKQSMTPEYLFVSGDRLYVQVDLRWRENKVIIQRKAVFSQKIGGKDGLRYEKGLTECLANPVKNQKKFEKIYDDEDDEGEMSLFLSRGTCLYMSEEKCFMELYDPEQDKNRVACYDLSSGSMKFLTKKDPDWYVPFYDGVLPDWAETLYPDDIRCDLPNNKAVNWPYW